MADLSCYIATFNCGRTLVNVDHFATNFFNGLTTNLPPDLVVLSLEEIAPIGHSFIGGSFLAPYFTRLTTAVHVAAAKRFESENEYESVLVRNVGMTAIMIFAKSSIQQQIKWIETAGVGFGYWEMGNKGAVAARIGFEIDEDESKEMVVTFVGAHFAPMEEDWEARNGDWKTTCEGLIFERDSLRGHSRRVSESESDSDPLLASSTSNGMKDGERTLFSPISHVFFFGDLNYRTSDTPPKVDDFDNFPQPVDSISDIRYYGHLLEHDQLSRERRKGKTLHHLSESEINFPPTYKYSEAAQKRAAHASLKQEVNEDQVWLWAKHRFPSWCDRILYLDTAPPTVHSYTALPVQPTSDHRPVVLSFSIPLKSLDRSAQDVKPPFAIRKDWREARAVAKRYEYIVGILAYLSLTWEGEALLGGTLIGAIGGFVALRALLGA